MWKLIRDKIPEIVAAKWEVIETRVLNDEEYNKSLFAKLLEESQEVSDSHWDLEELADVLEVIDAISKLKGYSKDDLENIRLEKLKERGWFEKKIYLEY